MQIGFNYGALSDPLEEQANKQGFTLGEKAELFEEMADVHIMIEQVLRHYWQDGDGKLDYYINEKLTRQLGRIANEDK